MDNLRGSPNHNTNMQPKFRNIRGEVLHDNPLERFITRSGCLGHKLAWFL